MERKKILLAITGSIAAYKAAFLVRLLIKNGDEVKVVMTQAARSFITPLTLSTLSGYPVYISAASDDSWNNHVELAHWADAMLIAPATANTLAKLANGLCDNMVAATYLSARCPVFIAPAMDLDMWKHPATQRNIRLLQNAGNISIPVGYGELASGLTGDGRMAEPDEIVSFLKRYFKKNNNTLAGIRALVTAGPTYEPIDPVRFIGNYSSGKMGIAIAQALIDRGADVELVLGPSRESIEHPRLNLHSVTTAAEMHEKSNELFPECQLAVLAAAVADYRPADVAAEKIKKKEEDMSIRLERTDDIAVGLGKVKKPNQVVVGFALETTDELRHARAKLEEKNFDFIVLNSLNEKGAGFGLDTNKISILSKDNKTEHFELKSKSAVAADIVDRIETLFLKKS